MDKVLWDSDWRDPHPNWYYRNHHKAWTPGDKVKLLALFHDGTPLRILCERLERTKQGILYGLRCAGLIHRGEDDRYYLGNWQHGIKSPERPTVADFAVTSTTVDTRPTPSNSGTTDMNTQVNIPVLNDESFTVTTRTYIGDVNAASLTDHQIYSKIAEIEAHAATLKNIKNKPDSLKAYLLKLLAMALALGQYVDSRNAK